MQTHHLDLNLLQLLLDEAPHLQHASTDLLEVLIEAARDVMAEICGFHGASDVATR